MRIDPVRDKVRANAAHAAKFPRRKKKDRKKARQVRVLFRELRWLAESGIPRDPEYPLFAGHKRTKGKYLP